MKDKEMEKLIDACYDVMFQREAEMEKTKDFIIKNNEPTKKMTAITRFINQQISELKGDK